MFAKRSIWYAVVNVLLVGLIAVVFTPGWGLENGRPAPALFMSFAFLELFFAGLTTVATFFSASIVVLKEEWRSLTFYSFSSSVKVVVQAWSQGLFWFVTLLFLEFPAVGALVHIATAVKIGNTVALPTILFSAYLFFKVLSAEVLRRSTDPISNP